MATRIVNALRTRVFEELDHKKEKLVRICPNYDDSKWGYVVTADLHD